MRDAGNINSPRNWERAKKVLSDMNWDFAVFGGEPLLAPIEHLEEVWKFGFERFHKNGLQTNGSLITPDHIELFKKYNVGVGISVDGPGPLNSLRSCGDYDSTLVATERTLDAITKLCREGMPPSIIVTIHKENASPFRIGALMNWLEGLQEIGVRFINLHNLEVEKGREQDALSEEETIAAFLDLYEWSKTSKLRVEPYCDIRALLTELSPHVSCVWNHCDPATTNAVQGVGPDGSRSNCGRTNKDGVNWIKADTPGFERYILLHHTPQEFGGCKDCKYFAHCKGQCPGTAIDGDWRNRTRDCRMWYSLFERIEKDLLLEGRQIVDGQRKTEGLVTHWMGDHTDTPHVDTPHIDTPHEDWHLDTDQKYEGGIPGVIINGPPPQFQSS